LFFFSLDTIDPCTAKARLTSTWETEQSGLIAMQPSPQTE